MGFPGFTLKHKGPWGYGGFLLTYDTTGLQFRINAGDQHPTVALPRMTVGIIMLRLRTRAGLGRGGWTYRGLCTAREFQKLPWRCVSRGDLFKRPKGRQVQIPFFEIVMGGGAGNPSVTATFPIALAGKQLRVCCSHLLMLRRAVVIRKQILRGVRMLVALCRLRTGSGVNAAAPLTDPLILQNQGFQYGVTGTREWVRTSDDRHSSGHRRKGRGSGRQ
jgi:hypothetical protein